MKQESAQLGRTKLTCEPSNRWCRELTMSLGGWLSEVSWSLFFFFQAEDGIRDVAVTGVQTCALPISAQAEANRPARPCEIGRWALAGVWQPLHFTTSPGFTCSHTPCADPTRRALAFRDRKSVV